MNQKSLFDAVQAASAQPPHSDEDTSKQAAESVRKDAARLRSLVLDFITQQAERGATCDEVEVALGLSHQTISPRVWELAGSNRKANLPKLITKTERRRATRTGRTAAVYVESSYA